MECYNKHIISRDKVVLLYSLMYFIPVAQRIEQLTPNEQMAVRFCPGIPSQARLQRVTI